MIDEKVAKAREDMELKFEKEREKNKAEMEEMKIRNQKEMQEEIDRKVEEMKDAYEKERAGMLKEQQQLKDYWEMRQQESNRQFVINQVKLLLIDCRLFCNCNVWYI